MPEISVIVPVYKVEEYLDECINSILNQSFKDYELILVDDGSPDKCGQICDDYAKKDSRIKVIHQENKGLSAARNAGLDILIGNYIAFIDSDDVVECHYLQTLYSALIKEKADISSCMAKAFSDRCDYRRSETDDVIISMSGREAALMQYESGYQKPVMVTAWGKLYVKGLFSGVRFPHGRYHEDEAVIPVLLYNANIVAASTAVLYGYRIRKNSIMQEKFSLKRYDGILGIEECAKYFKKQNDNTLYEAATKRKDVLVALYSLLARKARIFNDLPECYKISRTKAIRCLRETLPYAAYEYQLAKVYPGLVFITSRMRKLRKMLGLKVKE